MRNRRDSDDDDRHFWLANEIDLEKFKSQIRWTPAIGELYELWQNKFKLLHEDGYVKITREGIRLPFPIQYELFEKIAIEKNYRQYISKLESLVDITREYIRDIERYCIMRPGSFDLTIDKDYRNYMFSDSELSKYDHLLNSNTLDCLKFINAKSWDELKNLYYNINPLCLRKCPQLNLLFFQAFVLKSRETEDNYSQLDRVAFHFNLIFRASKISGISYDQVKALIPDFDIKSKKEENDDDKGKKENDHDEPESFSTTATTTTNKKRKVIEATAATSTATAIAGGQYLEQEPIAKRTRCKTRM